MSFLSIIVIFAIVGFAAFIIGKKQSLKFKASGKMKSLPSFYGWCMVSWTFIIAVSLAVVWLYASSKISINLGGSSVFIIAALSLAMAYSANQIVVTPKFHARYHVEKIVYYVLFLSAAISITITIAIVASVLFESIKFFQEVPITDFLFGTEWSPQTALRADQAGSSGSFGMVPVFAGTFLITLIAMIVAVPLGLMAAIYLSEYASGKVRAIVKPALEILAGIPTVVYGYFAVVTLSPMVRDLGLDLGLVISSESALIAGVVIGIMIIPFVLSLSDDVMNSVPMSLRDASLALGGTKTETVKKVVVPAALPGIIGSVLLAMSRAIGETMIVVMAAGLAAKMTLNPFESVTTVTAQIVTLLVGDQEFDSAKTLSAFALGLVLFIITLLLNIISLFVVRKYSEQYD